MNRTTYLRSTSVLGLLILSSLLIYAQTEPTFQFAYEYSSNRDICLITIDGTNNYCLSNTKDVIESNPVWSPDGSYIIYTATDEPLGIGQSKILVYNIETKETIEWSQHWYIYDWYLDGKSLLVGSTVENSVSRIYRINVDGTDPQLLSATTETYNVDASLSPDETSILYLSGYPEAKLMVMSVSGENQQALTDNLPINREVQPQWSPDGSTIAFSVNGEFVGRDQTSEIYVIQSDGGNLRQLTQTKGVTLHPRWSPDGTQLVFYGYAVGAFDSENSTTSLRTEVFRINADGSNLVNLTQNTGLDYQPEWSPDGQWIAFASLLYGQPGIYIMRPDGSDLQMVTDEPPFSEGGGEPNTPVWRPVGGG